MDLLPSLWLPILLSAVVVWIAAFVAWSFLPHHARDWTGLPDEGAFINAIRSLGIPPGRYCFPHCADRRMRKDPEFQRKWKEGPAGEFNLWRPVNMARNMALTFVVYLVIGFLVGYLAAATLQRGDSFGRFFQVTATAGILGYAFGHIPHAIWFQHGRNSILSTLADGVVYGLLTGLVFALLRPAAAASALAPGA